MTEGRDIQAKVTPNDGETMWVRATYTAARGEDTK